jgi:hypothetical protein
MATHGLSRLHSEHIEGRHWTRGRSWERGTGRVLDSNLGRDISHLQHHELVANPKTSGALTNRADCVMRRLLVDASFVTVEVYAGV